MGPRSWDRGEFIAPRARLHGTHGFNGAAVLGPRRARTKAGRSWSRSSFNGAAVLGPRRGNRSALRNPARAWLQWGRGLGTAESFKRNLSALPRTELQWGRGLGTPESFVRRITTGSEEPASMGQRPWDRGERATGPEAHLRAFASMGPRSWDRGESRIGAGHSSRRALQWGRGLGTAESASG